MRGVADHAGKAGRIEHALFLVEVPAAVLLRHQTALQPVGEFGDCTLQAGQLLVKEGAEPGQFLFVAEFRGADDLVIFFGPGGIIETGWQVGHCPVGTDRHHAIVAGVSHFLFGALFQLLGILVAFTVLTIVVGWFRPHFRFGKTVLIVERQIEAVKVRAGPFLDPLAEHVETLDRARRGCLSGQFFPRQQCQSGRNRNFVAILRPRDRIGTHPHFQRGVEIVFGPGHAPRAQRVGAHLFERVETGTRNCFLRRILPVRRFIMVA